MMTDLFPAEDFDAWAEDYDRSVFHTQSFPFTGYEEVLNKVVGLANPEAGMSVLDLGIGTGNLALRFDALGCEIWGTDFSAAMLAKARSKLPEAHLFKADLRAVWPPELNHRFNRIVSAYVFHHFELGEKVQIIESLIRKYVEPDGSLIIADIAFQNRSDLEIVKRAAGDEWEEEYYWLINESIPALNEAGLRVEYLQVSSCAGIFSLHN